MSESATIHDLTERLQRLSATRPPPPADSSVLKRPADDANSHGMTREEIDAKIAASEARTDSRFERAMGEVRAEFAAINATLTHINGTLMDVKGGQRTSFWGVVGLIVAAVASILAALSFASDRFNAGAEATSIAQKAAQEAVAEYARNTPPPTP